MLTRKLMLAALLSGLCWAQGVCAKGSPAGPAVVATIKPLQFIAEAILDGVGSVSALIEGSGSPHHFNLSPNDRLVIEQADVLLWVDPEFEIYLAALFGDIAAKESSIIVTASEIPGLTLHRFPGGELDPHLWLSQDNATLIAQSLTEQLTSIYPEKASHFRAGLEQFRNGNEEQAQSLQRLFSNQQVANYLVYHDAYRYFEHDHGLSHSASLVTDPDVQPGMREVLEVRKTIKDTNPVCILLQPDASPALVATMVQNDAVSRITIDLLGSSLEPSPNAYRQLIDHVATGFSSCLNI
jgi:zinc transport system substrate-binding protein